MPDDLSSFAKADMSRIEPCDSKPAIQYRNPGPARSAKSPEMARLIRLIPKAMLLKEKMIKRTLRVAKTKEPSPCCGNGQWHARLNVNRRAKTGFHIHIKCTAVDCNFTFME